jgi:proteasome maturation protein
MLAKVYGSHVPLRLHMEEKILAQVRRFPGLPSSHIGLETLLGLETEIEFGDYLNRPEDSERMQPNPFEAMEQRLGDKPDSAL